MAQSGRAFWQSAFLCGLDLGLALSGRRFGADSDRDAKPPVKPDEQELAPLTNRVTLFSLSPAQSASQAMRDVFSCIRQTHDPIAPILGSSASLVLLSSFNITQKMLDEYFNDYMALLLFTRIKGLMNMVY